MFIATFRIVFSSIQRLYVSVALVLIHTLYSGPRFSVNCYTRHWSIQSSSFPLCQINQETAISWEPLRCPKVPVMTLVYKALMLIQWLVFIFQESH